MLNISSNLKSLKKYRKEVYHEMIHTLSLAVLDNVSKIESVRNENSVVPLCLSIFRNIKGLSSQTEGLFVERYDNISYLPKNTENVVRMFINSGTKFGYYNFPREDLYNLITDYSPFEMNQVFYINTQDKRYALQTYVVNGVSVIYRLPSSSVLYGIIQSVYNYIMPYLYYQEVIMFGLNSSVYYKAFILGVFCNNNFSKYISQRTFNKNIIDDAYNNLILISNLRIYNDAEDMINYMASISDEFNQNLIKSFSIGYYTRFVTAFEIDKYNNLFIQLNKAFTIINQYITHKRGDVPFGLHSYDIFDQNFKECNSTKLRTDYINKEVISYFKFNKKLSGMLQEIHPDIILGLFNLKLHLDMSGFSVLYINKSPIVEFINQITSVNLRKKPLVIKFILKNAVDQLYHELKEEGLIYFNQLECFFGYRNSHIILEEVKEDYQAWVKGSQNKYWRPQFEFIKKWAPDFFNFLNYKGKRIGEILRTNRFKYRNFSNLMGDKLGLMSAQGVVDGDFFKAETVKGKKKNINKYQYFNLYQDPDTYQPNPDNHLVNKVIIKREEFIKQRIVINSTMNTYPSLAKLNRYVMATTSGTGIMHVSNTKAQKAELYNRFQKYLLFNKHIENKYLILPLDYSSYDHTITLGFIESALLELAKYLGDEKEIYNLILEFKHFLKNETIYFKELGNDPINNSKYIFGMLSGWKITSSVESLGNAITSFGIMMELGYKVEDLITMGDDLVIIIDLPNLDREKQLLELKRVCDFYESLGFKMNFSKNSISYHFLEFLRITYQPGINFAYPTRILPSLTVVKPGREESLFGIIEFQSVLKKTLKRYGVNSQYLKIGQLTKQYNKRDIRKMGFKFLQSPYQFKLDRYNREDYQLKVNLKDSPIYKKYIKILGFPYSKIILDYISREVATKKVTLTEIKAYPRPVQRNISYMQDLNIISDLVHKFRNYLVPKDYIQYKIRLPDFHLAQICLIILENLDFINAKLFLTRVINNLKELGLIEPQQSMDSSTAIATSTDKKELIFRLLNDKLLVEEGNIPIVVLSFLKNKMLKFLSYYSSTADKRVKSICRKLMSKDKRYYVKFILGRMLSDMGESKIPLYGYLLANQAD